MGSHNRRHHHHHYPIPISSTPPAAHGCSGGCSCCCNENSSQSPLDPHLVQSITALLHQQQSYQQQQQQCFNPCCFQPGRVNSRQTPHSRTQTLHHAGVLEPTQFVVSSLLQRLDALESSLRQLSSSSTSADEYYPLRDAAARVIQAHFRAFLVRRSRTLRQLKSLASLKSAFNALTASISGKSGFNFELVTQKAMDLLLKLDSVQGGDPMIRGAKRSLSRDLVRFLEVVDSSRKRTVLYKSARKVMPVGCGKKSGARNVSNDYGDGSRNRKEIVEKLRHRVGKINDGLSRMCKDDVEEGIDFEGFQYDLIEEDDIVEEGEEDNKVILKPKNGGADQPPKVKKKCVSFAEDENVYTVLVESPGNGGNSFSSSNDDDDDDDVVEHYSDDEVEATKLETSSQNEQAPSGHGRLLAQKGKNEGNKVKASVGMQKEDGGFFFSAPVPVKMESRAHSTNPNSAAKNVS